ncbi:MAG: NACHT domain-containing protein [Acidobacteriota bacterium]|nr:NACHT domain-containing protein [Acidobacteriota bacterium]
MPESRRKLNKKLQRSKILTILSEKGKRFTEYAEAGSPIIESIGKYAEIVSDIPFLSVLKVFSKLLGEVTKINDPRELGYYACKIAFLDALQIALNSDEFFPPVESPVVIKEVEEQLKEIEFSNISYKTFSLDEPRQHEFFKLALENSEARLAILGFNENQRDYIRERIKDNYDECLRLLLTKRDTAERFAPFNSYISKEPKHFIAQEKLYSHADYQVWQYEFAPVLGKEPFSLKDVYIESECGWLNWGEIIGANDESAERVIRNELKQPKLDAFDETNGGRHKLLDVIMKLIADEENKQPIIIQGVAGSGKTSFTMRLCSELANRGLVPVRIRLRDINLNLNIEEALPRAVRLSEKQYADKDLFLDNYKIFNENGIAGFEKISRYVLILDGWDELSTSASESFKSRVEKVISRILDRFIRNNSLSYPVKIILTGRPSEQITTSELLTNDTPVLTLRSLTGEQLKQFVNHIHKAVQPGKIEEFETEFADFPTRYFSKDAVLDFTDWNNFDKTKFDSILKKYDRQKKHLEVLGLPLLAHLTAHLIKHWKGKNAIDLVENETTLYRNLINLTCEKAGKAHIDKRISADAAKHLSTFHGDELRKLLWATASAMSVFGDESISYDELERRLNESEELRKVVEKVSQENWLSSLLISFYFKGGVKELGCEFSHKSFREYLLAEAIVKELKEYGRAAKSFYEERQNEWDDFPENDQRRELSRNLSKLLAHQWLKDEVIDFLRNLLAWEIERAKDTGNQGFPIKSLDFSML